MTCVRRRLFVRCPSQSPYHEQFDLESTNFIRTSIPTHSTAISDMTSIAASGQLQNAMKYCTKVRKTGPVSKGSNNSVTV